MSPVDGFDEMKRSCELEIMAELWPCIYVFLFTPIIILIEYCTMKASVYSTEPFWWQECSGGMLFAVT